MKTLLVPVDFSSTCENAVNFAARLSMHYEYKRIILVKTFYDSMFENLMVSAEYSNFNQDTVNQQREEGREQLRHLRHTLEKKTGHGIKVITIESELPLLRAILDVIESEDPDMMILGTDNQSYSSGSFLAGNIIPIAKASPIRVLLIPSSYSYQPVEAALLPYNLQMLNDLDRVSSLKTTPQWSNMQLLVLNFGFNKHGSKAPEKIKEAEDKFQNLVKNFTHEFYYTEEDNVIDAISTFTKDHTVQLIIALPGRHSFVYSLTHASISQAIYRNARLPVLILK
jgi:nucleotide-binding universal stress UspA family protein